MAQYRLYLSAPMSNTSAGDFDALTVGLQFTVTAPVRLRAILWWQPAVGASLNDRTVGLYSTTDGITGTLVTPLKTQPVSGTGWQTVALDNPLMLMPGTYVAAVYHPFGQFAVISNYYILGGDGYTGGAGMTVNEVVIPDSLSALNGRQNAFVYGSSFSFPTEQYNGGMYGVDVLLDNTADLRVYDSSQWRKGYLHAYDGTDWRHGHLYVYDGSQWVPGEPDA